MFEDNYKSSDKEILERLVENIRDHPLQEAIKKTMEDLGIKDEVFSVNINTSSNSDNFTVELIEDADQSIMEKIKSSRENG